MPRTRIDWEDDDWTPTEEDFVNAEDTVQELQHDRLYEGVEADTDGSGASWLSNAVIIGSLSDHKLKSALARYRSIVRLCETELAARALLPRPSTAAYYRRSNATRGRAVGKASGRHAASDRKTGLKLTPSQMLKALEMLMKLKGESK